MRNRRSGERSHGHTARPSLFSCFIGRHSLSVRWRLYLLCDVPMARINLASRATDCIAWLRCESSRECRERCSVRNESEELNSSSGTPQTTRSRERAGNLDSRTSADGRAERVDGMRSSEARSITCFCTHLLLSFAFTFLISKLARVVTCLRKEPSCSRVLP
jgi:hypothetical protein